MGAKNICQEMIVKTKSRISMKIISSWFCFQRTYHLLKQIANLLGDVQIYRKRGGCRNKGGNSWTSTISLSQLKATSTRVGSDKVIGWKTNTTRQTFKANC